MLSLSILIFSQLLSTSFLLRFAIIANHSYFKLCPEAITITWSFECRILDQSGVSTNSVITAATSCGFLQNDVVEILEIQRLSLIFLSCDLIAFTWHPRFYLIPVDPFPEIQTSGAPLDCDEKAFKHICGEPATCIPDKWPSLESRPGLCRCQL